jgi:hypothetical protein
MDRAMKERRKRAAPPVVRRRAEERKRLPPDLEAFAAGDDDALKKPRRAPGLRDPRAVALIPGVANRDARVVFDARVRRFGGLFKTDRDRAAEELAEARRLGLWRAKNLVGWNAFVEDILQLSLDAATELLGSREIKPLSDVAIATWLRAEAGLLEIDDSATVHLRNDRLVLEIDPPKAASALTAVGRRCAPLVRDRETPPPRRKPPTDR